MKISRKQIKKDTTTSKVCDYKNIFLHEYKDLLVNTYRFGQRPPDNVRRKDGLCLSLAKNKKEFVNVCYDYYNNKSHENKLD